MYSKLYVNFSDILLTDSCQASLSLGNRTPQILDKTNIMHIRIPWSLVPTKWFRGLNLSINLNPDPSKIPDFNNKLVVNNILINYIRDEVHIQKAIAVYEYGPKGKTYGKLHFHIAIKTNNQKAVREGLALLFNKKVNCRHRTINAKRFRDEKHRQDYINYMHKENQNKIKCLFVKNL